MPNERWPVYKIANVTLAFALVACVVIGWWWYWAVPTTVLVVRHAEKASATSVDPHLGPAGLIRAQELARVANSAGVEGIYATEFLRTQETVGPLASELGLSVLVVAAADVAGLVDQVLADNRGGVVVVAGHSNTVPMIIDELGAGTPCPAMFPLAAGGVCLVPDNQYDNLMVVTIPRWGTRSVVRLRYGASTP